jgi:hypothetical protein
MQPSVPRASASATRPLDELLLAASDVSVVDQATLSLWHFQQLLRRYLPAAPATTPSTEKPVDMEDKENSGPVAPAVSAVTLIPTVELEDGMAVAAMTFSEASSEESTKRAEDQPVDAADTSDSTRRACIALTTKVAVIYRRYRCVLSLDASPSALSIDSATGKVFLDMLYESVEVRGAERNDLAACW